MTYQELVQKIVDLQKDGLELFNIGKSTLGKNILATHIGSFDGVQIIIQGGLHAREYISTLLMIEQARYLPNGRIDLQTIDEKIRIVANMLDWMKYLPD